jgi:hypothetical protein
MNEKELSYCKNCGDIVEKNFCSNCGQKRKELDASFKELLIEVLNETFSLDSKLFKTIKILFLKPGQLSIEYLKGKRVKYITPFRLYLIISILFFVLLHFKKFVYPDLKIAYTEIKTYGILPDSTRAMEKFSISEPEKNMEKTSDNLKLQVSNNDVDSLIDKKDFIKKAINTFQHSLFFLLPVGALFLQLLFLRKRKRYIEHLILMTHLQSAVFLVLILNIIIDFSFFNWISLLFLNYYFIRSLIVFYNQKIVKVFLKLQLFLLMYFVVFIINGIIALILPVFVLYYVS